MVRLQFDLTVALSRSSLDARRGVVRVHPYVLDVLRMRPWDPLEVRGLRTTAALAAATRVDAEESRIYLDELTCANAGVAPGNTVSVGRADVVPAVAVELSGVPSEDLEPELLRLVLLGKVVGAGTESPSFPRTSPAPGMPPTSYTSSFRRSSNPSETTGEALTSRSPGRSPDAS